MDTIWYDMIRRCNNANCKDYPSYGGRGIKVCNAWLSRDVFLNWLADNGYAKGLEIERIDNDLGYSPDNCKVATRRENSLNRRLFKNNTTGYRGVRSFMEYFDLYQKNMLPSANEEEVKKFDIEILTAQLVRYFEFLRFIPHEFDVKGNGDIQVQDSEET